MKICQFIILGKNVFGLIYLGKNIKKIKNKEKNNGY